MDQEFWKDIKGLEGFYQASSMGRIRSLPRRIIKNNGVESNYNGRILNTKTKDTIHYLAVRFGNVQSRRVHRIIAETFIPNPENKPQVNHINGIKTDNRVENLEWNTHRENTIHAFENNLIKKSRKGIKFMSKDTVIYIRNSNKSINEIKDELNLSYCHVLRIRRRVIWKNV